MALPEELPLTRSELRKLFKAAGYTTYSQLGKALGVTKTTVCKWLNGNLNLSEKAKEAIRIIPVLPGAESTWNDYLAEVPLTIAHYKANLPPPETDEALAMDPKALAEAIVKDLAPRLKADAEELAERLENKLDAKGIALDITDQLLPHLHKVVEEAAQKFAAAVDGQEDTREAVEKALEDCGERIALLLKQNPHEVAEAVVARTEGLFATLKDGLDAVRGMLQGLVSKVDSQTTQDGQERARERAKADAHHRESRLQVLVLVGTMVIVGIALGTLIVVRTSGPAPGDGLTRGSLASDTAGDVKAAPPSPMWTFASEAGEKVSERYVPNEPMPGQKRAPCEPGLGESAINGGCWGAMADVKPPCGLLYRSGDKCYRPIFVYPNSPRSDEPRPGHLRPTQEMPGKAQ